MFVDAEYAFRKWLPKQPRMSVVKNVSFNFPSGSGTGSIVYPIVTLARIGGLPDRNVPLDNPRISFSVWATNKEDAANGMLALCDTLYPANNVALNDKVYLYDVSVDSVYYSPDTQNNLARYIVDVTAMVRAL